MPAVQTSDCAVIWPLAIPAWICCRLNGPLGWPLISTWYIAWLGSGGGAAPMPAAGAPPPMAPPIWPAIWLAMAMPIPACMKSPMALPPGLPAAATMASAAATCWYLLMSPMLRR